VTWVSPLRRCATYTDSYGFAEVGSPAAVLLTPSNGVEFIYRATSGGTAVSNYSTGIVGPVWVKVSYSGTSVSGYYSPDGVTWTQIGTTATITGFSPTLVGLAVSSFNNSYAGYATFTNVDPSRVGIPKGHDDIVIASDRRHGNKFLSRNQPALVNQK